MAFLDKTGLEHLWAQIVNQLNTKENLDSKTTIISETSTNAQYPGAKAVYDFVTASIPDTSTFATTADLTDGTITVKNAINAEEAAHAAWANGTNNADYATAAGKAGKDGDGNVIVDTYATKTQLSDGSVTKVGTSTVGSATKPVYLNAGVPTAGTYTLGAACAKSVSDSNAASALSSTDTNVPTVRDIYYGLPSINGRHTYTSGTNIYAPESYASSGYFLQGAGVNNSPTWTNRIMTPDVAKWPNASGSSETNSVGCVFNFTAPTASNPSGTASTGKFGIIAFRAKISSNSNLVTMPITFKDANAYEVLACRIGETSDYQAQRNTVKKISGSQIGIPYANSTSIQYCFIAFGEVAK